MEGDPSTPGRLQGEAADSPASQLGCSPGTWGRRGKGGGGERGRGRLSTPPAGLSRLPSSSLGAPRPGKRHPLAASAPHCTPGPAAAASAPARCWVRTRGAPGARGARGARGGGGGGGAGPRLPLGGAAARRSAGARETEPSTARLGRGRGAARSRHPKTATGWRRAPSAPRPSSESVPAGSAAPAPRAPASRPRAARPLPFRPWRVWKGGFGAGGGSGGGPGGGAVSAAGPSFAPPGLSLSLLLPPAPGGARHGGAGARQARYGDGETGEAWCRKVGVGGQGTGRIGGAKGGEAQGSRTRGRGGVPGTWGPWMEKGDEAGQVWNRGRGRTAIRRGAWEEK